MMTAKLDGTRRMRKFLIGLAITATVVVLAACGHMMMGTGAEKPAPAEFGFGPRQSVAGLYTVTLDPVQPIRVRRMQTMRVVIRDIEGRAVDGATIAVDGGMPEHGHGLPTQPRVTRALGEGAYQVDGVKFNMGGWWEVKLAIDAAAGADTVTFNLDL